MANFEDFIKDFDLTDGKRISARQIPNLQKKGRLAILGDVLFEFSYRKYNC